MKLEIISRTATSLTKLKVLSRAIFEWEIDSKTTRIRQDNRVVKFDSTALHELIEQGLRLYNVLMRQVAKAAIGSSRSYGHVARVRDNFGVFALRGVQAW